MLIALFVILAYLTGSVSFAIIMSKVFRLPDPRSYGSHNPGATNVLRSGKKLAAALTLLGDAGKGWLAVRLAQHFAPPDQNALMLVSVAALAVFLGHLYPVFLRFKGGKGVATALGVLLALDIWLGLAALATWIGVAVIFRLSSLAALLAAAAAPLYAWLLSLPGEYLMVSWVLALLLVWRHKPNIVNLLQGKESRIGHKSDARADLKRSR